MPQEASRDAIQTTFLWPEAVELTFRVGIVHASEHLQLQWEVRSATDGQLLDLEAAPHRPLSEAPWVIDDMWAKFREVIAYWTPPF